MRRRLGRNSRDRRPSPGVVGVGTLALGLLAPAPAVAGDEGPELSAPVGPGSAHSTPAPVPAAAPIPRPIVSTPAPRRPVLALPGITTPAAAPTPARAPAPSSDLDLELPALDAPRGMNQAPPPARSALPPPMEALPFEPASGLPELPPTSPRGTPARRSTDVPPARSAGPANRPGAATAPPASMTAPNRRPWWFGGPARPGMPVPNNPAGRAGVGEGSASREAAPSDPKAELALQKKLERQARALVGDRARSVDVRVAGKQVVIEARGVRMFQKRNVRKTLETMPVQGGLRPTVQVFD